MFGHELSTKTYDTFSYQKVPQGCGRKVDIYLVDKYLPDTVWHYATFIEEVTPSNLYAATKAALLEYPDAKVSMVKF